jgi:hypothetical protein
MLSRKKKQNVTTFLDQVLFGAMIFLVSHARSLFTKTGGTGAEEQCFLNCE